MTILACVAEKGGVGKTTSAINLGAAWGASRPTILVDLDPQGSATRGVGLQPGGARLAAAMVGGAGDELVEETTWAGLSIVRGGPEVAGAAAQLARLDDGAEQLARALRALDVADTLVIIDCPPTLGTLTIGALLASRWALIPAACEGAAIWGVDNALATIQELRRPPTRAAVELLGILPTLFDARTAHGREVEQLFRDRWGSAVTTTSIRRDVKLTESLTAGEPVSAWAPAAVATQLYASAARELLARMEVAR